MYHDDGGGGKAEGNRGIEYGERARVGRQKLKRRAEIERQAREANEKLSVGRSRRGNGSVACKLKIL